jgi:hypothetical protein
MYIYKYTGLSEILWARIVIKKNPILQIDFSLKIPKILQNKFL